MDLSLSNREQVLYELGRDPVLAHAVLFGDKHQNKTPPFHHESIRRWHSRHPRVGDMDFRGAAKSTRAEEAMTIVALYQRARNIVVLGESEERAVERLKPIKHAIENNEFIATLFEVGPGETWTEAKIELSNGVFLQAYGRGQSLRGVKHLDSRPDLIFMDNLEDEESVSTPEQRNKVLSWYTGTVLPALSPNGRIRMAATPLNPEALAVKLSRSSEWDFATHPIMYKDENGEWTASWPDRYSIDKCLELWAEMRSVGQEDKFMQEYLCQAVNPATQVFTPDMIRVKVQPRSYHAVYAMVDPARSKKATSATTGFAAWSWIGPRLVVWDAWAKRILPDEIVNGLFTFNDEYNPVAIGFEETGLNEWALQPIRKLQAERGEVLPLRALNAPRGKMDFIRGLQPYFRAGEVEFAKDLPDLRAQLLAFPTGDIDAPNALAYALKMRAGVPVFEGFGEQHVSTLPMKPIDRAPLWLAVNSDGTVTTAVLCQVAHGRLSIFADWLLEGEPGSTLRDILQEATLAASARSGAVGASPAGKASVQGSPRRAALRLITPREHFETYDVIGLRAAARKLSADVSRGGDSLSGREELRALLGRSAHGQPALQIAAGARWTARAFAGGYARDLNAAEPQQGPYAVLMAALEAFAGLLRGASFQEDESEINYAWTPEGKRYISARAR